MDKYHRRINTYFKVGRLHRIWIRFWLRFSGYGRWGFISPWLASLFAPPHKAGSVLAGLHPNGFVAPSATLYHSDLRLGRHVYIADRVVLYQNHEGDFVHLGDRVAVLRDCALETGWGGSLTIGANTWIQPRCQINAYKGSVYIGNGVDIAPNCALYSYDHNFAPGLSIRNQALKTKGDIIIGDETWLGFGAIVLSGVHIGAGAVIGAGALVCTDIPENAIAVGMPAKVIKMRNEVNEKD
jgi:acetyltransferase-like isoleucine patch superfamily enzyme